MTKSLFDTLSSLYTAIADETDNKASALLLLQLRSWLTKLCKFDPRSGHELPQGLDEILQKLATEDSPHKSAIQDRLYRILEHVNDALQTTLDNVNHKILREHAMVPIYAAREVDSVSIQWLSKQTGRNLREKLAGKPYIKAVRRRSSSDTTENKLLKAFAIKLEDKLYHQEALFKALSLGYNDKLLLGLQRWLRHEEAKEIGLWNNIPPNNTLLQDRRYRKVWEAWLWLQRLDDDIQRDSNRLSADLLTAIYWSMISVLKQSTRVRLTQQPVIFDYDNYQLFPFDDTIKGYLYPEKDHSVQYGVIRNIVAGKPFGFIRTKEKNDYFFHANDLIAGLDLENLKVKTAVSFVAGKNNQGECAKKISLYKEVRPKKLTSSLSDDKIQITVESEKSFVLEKIDVELSLQLNPKDLSHFVSQVSDTLLNTLKIQKIKSDISQATKTVAESTVIDLCATRPIYTTDSDPASAQHLPFRLLLQRWRHESTGSIDIDCSSSTAIRLTPTILSTSMYDLFSDDKSEDKQVKEFRSQSALFFANKIRQQIQTNRLTYLVPDAINDFSLETTRKSINFYYPKATPLPKSIASIFEWQSSSSFQTSKIKENDIVVVTDITNNGYSFTPVICKFKDELKSKITDSRGFYWERHPSVVIDKKNITHRLVEIIKTISNPNEILALFGSEGLINEAGQLSFCDDKQKWFDIPDELKSFLSANKIEYSSIANEIRESLPVIKRLSRKSTLFILPLSQGINTPKSNDKSVFLLKNNRAITTGGLSLNQWQEQAGDIPLWRDHLPELSIEIPQEGRTQQFFLVKDTTVAPMRGKRITIPIKETFTLPANKSNYQFPLKMGDGRQALHHSAELRSPHFPLAVDTVCTLKMTYTYGDDDPYQLKFVPVDPKKAGFNSILVDWRSMGSLPPIDLSSLPVPDFPKPKTWAYFRMYPKENGDGYSDLLGWVKRDIEKIINYEIFFCGPECNRIYYEEMEGIWSWKEDKNGNKISWVSIDISGKPHEIFFHESDFEKYEENANSISFDLMEQQGRNGFKAINITLGKTIPNKTINQLKKSWRFPIFTIWNNGHSLSESDAPNDFRNIIQEGSESALSLINSEGVPKSLKDELFFFLSCFHKDAPMQVAESLIEYSKDKQNLRKFHRHIAFAIGSGELDWQKVLLANTLNPIDNEGLTRSITLEILAIAFWRVESLIFELDEDTIDALLNTLLGCFRIDLNKIQEQKNSYKVNTLCRHLELLLALLRTRKYESEQIKLLLSPGRDITKKLIIVIDDIINNDIQLKSRIDLNIDKPESFYKTPDLLYALKMYLTGDVAGNTIIVNSISMDDK
ncbi:MAG: DUF2357 domain-containing protein [Gammaproteobacteria bacterium]|nr:DUF2357 domain-containing protein [Gammaproteobacteria bacterium]